MWPHYWSTTARVDQLDPQLLGIQHGSAAGSDPGQGHRQRGGTLKGGGSVPYAYAAHSEKPTSILFDKEIEEKCTEVCQKACYSGFW